MRILRAAIALIIFVSFVAALAWLSARPARRRQ
jgi:hypothetical protein